MNHCRLDYLEAMRSDYGRGKNGKDYGHIDLDSIIYEKQSIKDQRAITLALSQLNDEPPEITELILQSIGEIPPRVPASIKLIPRILKTLNMNLKDELINTSMGITF